MKLFVKWALVALACSALVVGCGDGDDGNGDDNNNGSDTTAVIVQ